MFNKTAVDSDLYPFLCLSTDIFFKLRRGNSCHSSLMSCFSFLSKTDRFLSRWSGVQAVKTSTNFVSLTVVWGSVGSEVIAQYQLLARIVWFLYILSCSLVTLLQMRLPVTTHSCACKADVPTCLASEASWLPAFNLTVIYPWGFS